MFTVQNIDQTHVFNKKCLKKTHEEAADIEHTNQYSSVLDSRTHKPGLRSIQKIHFFLFPNKNEI